jgi:hypothetical protein
MKSLAKIEISFENTEHAHVSYQTDKMGDRKGAEIEMMAFFSAYYAKILYNLDEETSLLLIESINNIAQHPFNKDGSPDELFFDGLNIERQIPEKINKKYTGILYEDYTVKTECSRGMEHVYAPFSVLYFLKYSIIMTTVFPPAKNFLWYILEEMQKIYTGSLGIHRTSSSITEVPSMAQSIALERIKKDAGDFKKGVL